MDVRDVNRVEADLMDRETLFDIGLFLEDEEVEIFPFYHVVVDVAEFFAQGREFVARETRDDAVDEGRGVMAILAEVGTESFVHAPCLGKTQQHFLEAVAVVVDELAREDGEAMSAAKRVITPLEQGEQLPGEGNGGFRFEVDGDVLFLEANAGFGRVGDDDFQILRFAIMEEGTIIFIRVHEIVQDIDEAGVADGFSLLVDPLEDQGVEAILLFEFLDPAERQGLDDDHMPLILAGIVHLLDEPVDEGAQKIPLAKLHDLDGGGRLLGDLGAQHGQRFHRMESFLYPRRYSL